MLNSSILLLIPSEKSKYYEKLYVKVGVTVNINPGQPKINGRSQLRLHLLARLIRKPRLTFLSTIGFVLL